MRKKIVGFLLIKDVLYVITIALIGCVGIIFSVLYIQTFESGFFKEYSSILIAISLFLISAITLIAIIFYKLSRNFVYKLAFLTVVLISIVVLSLYLLKITGFLDKIDSIEDLRAFVSSFDGYAVALFVALQFLQVVVLPIPAFITVGAGVLLFGPLKGSFLSCIGIIAGSIVSFFIGRIFGYKVVKWLVGKESLDKGLKTIKGKDKVILTFMFLFPFFPDDVLCFVAGITTVSPTFFIVMIFITRIISVFASSYSMNNSIIPYDTWWGILLWIIFFAFTVVVAYFICKKGDVIERFFNSKRKRHGKIKKNRDDYV